VVDRGTFYGVVAILVASLMVTSSLALVYYAQYQDRAKASQEYATELGTALGSYRSLQGNFSESMKDLRATISLLGDALANLNTSSPSYANGSSALSSLWSSYLKLAKENGSAPLVYKVDLMVDFGNGTRRWFNDSAVQPGWNAYVVSLALLAGRVTASWYPAGYFGAGEPGEHFVTGISGVNSTSSTAWFFWTHKGGTWSLAPTGADGIEPQSGAVIAWTMCGYDASFFPTCTP
jgi:hypothetical protein